MGLIEVCDEMLRNWFIFSSESLGFLCELEEECERL